MSFDALKVDKSEAFESESFIFSSSSENNGTARSKKLQR